MATWTTKTNGQKIEPSHINLLQTWKVDTDCAAWGFLSSQDQAVKTTDSPSFAGQTLWNDADADFVPALTIRSGKTADYRGYILWRGYSSQTHWQMGKNATNEFILYNTPNDAHVLHCVPLGRTSLNSNGTEAVEINSYPTCGTAGLKVYSGGASPALVAQIEPSATHTYLKLYGKSGSGYGSLRLFDEDAAEYLEAFCNGGSGFIRMAGTSPQYLYLQYGKTGNVSVFCATTANPLLQVYGYITAGTAARYGFLQVENTNDEFVLGAENNANIEGVTVRLMEANQRFRIRASGGGVVAHILDSGILNLSNCPNYADNDAALAGGLVSGDLYTVTGTDPLQVAKVI